MGHLERVTNFRVGWARSHWQHNATHECTEKLPWPPFAISEGPLRKRQGPPNAPEAITNDKIEPLNTPKLDSLFKKPKNLGEEGPERHVTPQKHNSKINPLFNLS